jgi:hypothetical protein
MYLEKSSTMVTDRLAGQRRATAARQDGHTELLAISIAACTSPLWRGDHTHRLDLIDRCVSE